jgi:hypothetical protein
MTREETIEAIRVMQAFVDGKEVEFKNRHQLTNGLPLWVPASNPVWNWIDDIKSFRIKPTAKLRPWTANEIPLGAWMRNKSVQYDRWIIVHLQYSSLNREEWLDKYEHSIDGGKNWLPCGVVEEAK